MRYLIFILLSFYCISCQYPTENKSNYFLPIESISRVEDNIKTAYEDAKLLSIYSNQVNLDGKSKIWSYIYFSPFLDKNIYIHSTVNTVTVDSLSSNILNNGHDINCSIIESSNVINKAEENGLKEFINKYPNYSIELTLYQPEDWDRPIWDLLVLSNDKIGFTNALVVFGDTGELVPIIE